MPPTKQCLKCKKTKPVSEFHRTGKTKDGYTYWCKDCVSISGRQWYARHAEREREKDRQYQKDNPEKIEDARL